MCQLMVIERRDEVKRDKKEEKGAEDGDIGVQGEREAKVEVGDDAQEKKEREKKNNKNLRTRTRTRTRKRTRKRKRKRKKKK